MKLILTFSIIFITYISASTQIVIGTFSKHSSAISVKHKLNDVLDKETELKELLVNNNIQSVTKQDGKYFLVTLEPFEDRAVQNTVLGKIKETEFKDAYVLRLQKENQEPVKQEEVKKQKPKSVVKEKPTPKIEKTIQEAERVVPKEVKVQKVTPMPETKAPKIETVIPKEVKVQKPVAKPKPIKIKEPEQANFVQTYMLEIIAFIAILILTLVYIFILKNKQKNLQDDTHQMQDSEPEDIIPDDVTDVRDYFDENDQDDIQEESVISAPDAASIEMDEEELIKDEYDVEDDIENVIEDTKKEDVQELDKLKSSIEKKDVPSHGKISKDNFKEFEGMRVMIAEDNLINQKVIKGLLSESGINITIVDDGQEVLNHLEKDDAFCMILMDVHMPHMDGFEATKIIRSNPKYSHITVIALSGDVAADDIANMRAAGMQENLEKPLKMDALYDVLYAYGYHREDKIELEHEEKHDTSSTKELDVASGIEVCGGDEDFYREILKDFLNNYDGSSKRIQDFLNNNERNAAQQILLDISG